MRWMLSDLLLSCFTTTTIICAAQLSPQPKEPDPQQPNSQSAAHVIPRPELSPQAAYNEAVRPLDIVRRAAQNWSDVELNALAVATKQAQTACSERNGAQFTGEDLLAYARLCAFAQMWDQVKDSATNCLVAEHTANASEKANFPNLSMAFDYVVQADLHLKDSDSAFGTAQLMLRTVAYDDMASEAVNTTVRYVQLIHTDEALALLEQRQPLLLELPKDRPPAGVAPPPGAHPPLSIHELYADAIELPTMQQFANDPKGAAKSFAELQQILPPDLSPDDIILTAASRRQYLLLGSRLPPIHAAALLNDASYAVRREIDSRFGAATIFFLFPDWCAQCVATGELFPTVSANLGKSGAQFYALLAQDNAVAPAPKTPTKRTPVKIGASKVHQEMQLNIKPTAAELLRGTPTVIVPSEVLKTFVATDFPLIIAVDHRGIVRYIQPAPDNALVPGGLVEQLAERLIKQWPMGPAETATGTREHKGTATYDSGR